MNDTPNTPQNTLKYAQMTEIVEQLRPLAVPIDSIDDAETNPNRGDVDAISRSLQRFGQRKPIVVNRASNRIEAGHHLRAAAKQLGWEEIAAVFVDDDDITAAGYLLADNRTGQLAETDDDLLADLLSSLDGTDIFDAVGYTASDIADLIESRDTSAFVPISDTNTLDERPQTTCPECGHTWIPSL